MIYICGSCGFIFERSGEPSQCPDCEKENIRIASEEEKAQFVELITELDKRKTERQ